MQSNGPLTPWQWALLAGVIGILAAGIAGGQDSNRQSNLEPDYSAELPRIPPKSPEEALKSFRISPGFRIELCASEPLIASPVALDFDENGRLFIAEYPEFNQSVSKLPHGHGRIRILEDTQGDGVYDKSSIFLDNLESPTAVCCYDGGVFIGSVPDILFAKDTDGDDRADIRRVIFTGFARDVGGEAMLNSFRWSLDNRIHVQTSYSGGQIRHHDNPLAKPVTVRGQLFLFDPRTEKFEVTSGGGQHGLTYDDWGRTLVCTNANPIHLIMYDGRYLTRNPYLAAPSAMSQIAPGGYGAKVFRISPDEPWRVVRTRLRSTGVESPHPTEKDEPSGYFTAASGLTVYRGDAWPAEQRGTILVGEVANNLIFRAKFEPRGLGLEAIRTEPRAEFLASTDVWFRPVQMANGPDGALYVLDMYRNLIQAGTSIPPAIMKHLDATGGFDQGRLYRVVPERFQRRPPPRLGQASISELVKYLEHENGWHRDTASRLIYQGQDASAAPLLKQLARTSRNSLARMHAMYALSGLMQLDQETVVVGLQDQDPRVREHAVRLAEPYLSASEVQVQLARLAEDEDLRVRYQLAFSLGNDSNAKSLGLLGRLARRDAADLWCRLAILSSVHRREVELFQLLIKDVQFRRSSPGRELLRSLVTLIGRANRKGEIAAVMRGLGVLADDDADLLKDLVANLVARLTAADLEQIAGEGASRTKASIVELREEALKTSSNEQRSADERVSAIRLLALAPFSEVEPAISRLLSFRQPQSVQAAAVEVLARFPDLGVAALLVRSWQGLSPRLRASALETLFSRPNWTLVFLDALDEGTIRISEVDTTRIQSLQSHADAGIRDRAAKLFGEAKLFDEAKLAGRGEVLASYQAALQMRGDRARGKAVFQKECSACHRHDGVGTQVGADLNAIRKQGAATILLHILDPNREVKPQFLGYVVLTENGRTVAGMIAEETPNSMTIRRADGTTENVLRIEIDDLKSTGKSFMPEGIEKLIDVSSMSDLLEYLGADP